MEFQNLVKLQAFQVTGKWEQKIKQDSEGICREIAQEIANNDKTDRVLVLLGFELFPKPYQAAFLSCTVSPVRNFQIYFILSDLSHPQLYFYFNPQSIGLIHGEDVIVWVQTYIWLLGRAFKNIESLGVELEDKFCFSSQVPEMKHAQICTLTRRDLEPICTKNGYFLDFTSIRQWQITIDQCPGLILQIQRQRNQILYGHRAARALTYKRSSDVGWGPAIIALLHLNHILREAILLGKTTG
ncbi:MAG: hypothetical protein ACE5R6_13445 [Candidatus Heimdallarchaeota archaeon]